MGQWKITTPPAIQPVTNTEVYDQAHIDDTASNSTWVTRAIQGATATAETMTQLSLITRTITAVYYPERADMTPSAIPFPAYTSLPLFRGPLQGVTSVTDGGNNTVTSYTLRKVGNVDFVQLLATIVGPITIVYTAGYGDTAAAVPDDIRDNIIAHVAHKWVHRELDADAEPVGLDRVYSKYRTGGAG
jgi:uncharacterized phiE125 gp8 family phage protein